jgi:uncharacterized protein (DUF2252 family)
LSPNERVARGKAARAEVPFEAHSVWSAALRRSHPVDLLEEQAKTRIRELVPIRHRRMLVSAFSYYRGAALPMAADLAATPDSGLTVQLCGDAHLSNFGVFGSPERHLVFDVNDFDETAPGPWEWDVKRLCSSLEIAARDNEFANKECTKIVRDAVRSYRETMRQLSAMSMLEVWYTHLDIDELLPRFHAALDPTRTPSVWHAVTSARAHDSIHAYDKLCHLVEGEPRIRSDPPLVTPIEELVVEPDSADADMRDSMERILREYAGSLDRDRRHLLEHYRVGHLARKVVGVGSVGTDCWIALMLERDRQAPLLLQVKEARRSVLEEYTAASLFPNEGQRVVAGQRLMQTASDIFLGWVGFEWQRGRRDYYVRQLHDWKGSADIRGMTAAGMNLWGQMCGWTLARAHARSGDRVAIASYLGKSDAFDRAIVDFATAYADQCAHDHALLKEAVDTGRLAAADAL